MQTPTARLRVTHHARERIRERLEPLSGGWSTAWSWLKRIYHDAQRDGMFSPVPPGWVDGRRLPYPDGKALWIVTAYEGTQVALLVNIDGALVTLITPDQVEVAC